MTQKTRVNTADVASMNERDERQERIPVEWVCVQRCFCPEGDNPLLARSWDPGESFWGVDPPSKHFVTREEYDRGTDGKAKYFTLIKKYGGSLNERIKALQIPALKAFAMQLEREYLRKQARRG